MEEGERDHEEKGLAGSPELPTCTAPTLLPPPPLPRSRCVSDAWHTFNYLSNFLNKH